MKLNSATDAPPQIEFISFHIGETLCGIPIYDVQEINPVSQITAVPLAPPYIRGMINLRGQIVAILDAGEKLGLGKTEKNRENRIVIVRGNEESIGLLVSTMGDVVTTDRSKIEPTPANIGAIQAAFFDGVVNMDGTVLGILNLEKTLE
jgi:purine-binding chemotaxis protein CheW